MSSADGAGPRLTSREGAAAAPAEGVAFSADTVTGEGAGTETGGAAGVERGTGGIAEGETAAAASASALVSVLAFLAGDPRPTSSASGATAGGSARREDDAPPVPERAVRGESTGLSAFSAGASTNSSALRLSPATVLVAVSGRGSDDSKGCCFDGMPAVREVDSPSVAEAVVGAASVTEGAVAVGMSEEESATAAADSAELDASAGAGSVSGSGASTADVAAGSLLSAVLSLPPMWPLASLTGVTGLGKSALSLFSALLLKPPTGDSDFLAAASPLATSVFTVRSPEAGLERRPAMPVGSAGFVGWLMASDEPIYGKREAHVSAHVFGDVSNWPITGLDSPSLTCCDQWGSFWAWPLQVAHLAHQSVRSETNELAQPVDN